MSDVKSCAFTFDASTVSPDAGFDTLPKGWYNMQAISSEIRPTRDGQGAYIAVTFEIMDGFAKGRKIFQNFNIKNPNSEDAVRIGTSQLSAFMHAINYLKIQSSTGELHNKPFKGKLGIQKASDPQYDDQNVINTFRPYTEEVQLAQKPVAGASAGVSAPAGFSAPQPSAPANFGPPSGFAPQVAPVAPSAPVSAPVAPVAPVTPAAPPTPPAPVPQPVQKVRRLTAAGEKLGNLEAWRSKNWTDEMLIAQGYMEEVEETPAPPAIPSTPVPPPLPETPQATTSFSNTPATPANAPAAPAAPPTPPVHGLAKAPWEQ